MSAARSARAHELRGYSKNALASRCWVISGQAMPASRYRGWTEDELITEILRIEFGTASAAVSQ